MVEPQEGSRTEHVNAITPRHACAGTGTRRLHVLSVLTVCFVTLMSKITHFSQRYFFPNPLWSEVNVHSNERLWALQ